MLLTDFATDISSSPFNIQLNISEPFQLRLQSIGTDNTMMLLLLFSETVETVSAELTLDYSDTIYNSSVQTLPFTLNGTNDFLIVCDDPLKTKVPPNLCIVLPPEL
jgi:hypothetical protein